MADDRRLLCRCLGVASYRVEAVVRREGLRTVSEVTGAIRAGGNCGTCHPEIEEILAAARGEELDDFEVYENRLMCQQETLARIEGCVESLILPELREFGVTIEGLEVEGLRVRISLRGKRRADAAQWLARSLREYVCEDLEVEAAPPHDR